jgi:hypothetical protein
MTKPKPDARDGAHDDADDLFNVPVEAPHPAGMADIERAITRAERRIKRRAAARRSARTAMSALSLASASGDEPVSRRRIVWIACGALAAGAALALCVPVFKRASKKQESAPAMVKDAPPHGDARASMPAAQPSTEPLASRPAHDATAPTGEKARAERTTTAEPASIAKPSAARTPTPAPAVERAPVVAQSRDVVQPPPVVEAPAVVPTAPAIQPPVVVQPAAVVQPAPTHIETTPAVVQAPLTPAPAAHDVPPTADAHAESATPALRSSARAEPPLPVAQTSGSERLKVVEAALAAGRRAFARSELGRILLEIDVLPADAREETRAQAELLVARILQDAADGARRPDASDGARRPSR